jgi:WXG100 family type VII secretion target
MGDGYYYDYSKMGASVGQLQVISNRIEQLTNELETNCYKATESWAGKAKDAYVEQKAIWDAQCELMKSSLGKSALVLDTITTNTINTENRNTAAWDNVGTA